MKYVKTENGSIVWGPGLLPRVWKNISGLDNLSAEALKELGWLPLIQAKSPYLRYVKENISYEITSDGVEEKCDFVELPSEEEEQQP